MHGENNPLGTFTGTTARICSINVKHPSFKPGPQSINILHSSLTLRLKPPLPTHLYPIPFIPSIVLRPNPLVPYQIPPLQAKLPILTFLTPHPFQPRPTPPQSLPLTQSTSLTSPSAQPIIANNHPPITTSPHPETLSPSASLDPNTLAFTSVLQSEAPSLHHFSPPALNTPWTSHKHRPMRNLSEFFADLFSDQDEKELGSKSKLTRKTKKKAGRGRRGRSRKNHKSSKPSNSLETGFTLSDSNIQACNTAHNNKSFDWEASQI